MHITSEVSSTTNSGHSLTGDSQMHSTRSTSGSSKVSAQNNGASGGGGKGGSSSNQLSPLTAENFAERTIDGLLAEHPGELVRTGCPHVVRIIPVSVRSLFIYFLIPFPGLHCPSHPLAVQQDAANRLQSGGSRRSNGRDFGQCYGRK